MKDGTYKVSQGDHSPERDLQLTERPLLSHWPHSLSCWKDGLFFSPEMSSFSAKCDLCHLKGTELVSNSKEGPVTALPRAPPFCSPSLQTLLGLSQWPPKHQGPGKIWHTICLFNHLCADSLCPHENVFLLSLLSGTPTSHLVCAASHPQFTSSGGWRRRMGHSV